LSKQCFKRTRLIICTVKDSPIRPCCFFLFYGGGDFIGAKRRFFVLVVKIDKHWRRTVPFFGAESFAQTSVVVIDNGRRYFQNGRCRAVILLKADNVRARKTVGELKDVFYFRASEAVNGLVVVADHADISVSAAQFF